MRANPRPKLSRERYRIAHVMGGDSRDANCLCFCFSPPLSSLFAAAAGLKEVMVDYQAKYESLLRNVLSDLNSEVLAAQEHAEKNAEASSAYCTALKERLLKREAELEDKQKEMGALKEELTFTQAELAAARAKLEIYAEREAEKLVEREKIPRKESEQPLADSTCMASDGHVTNNAVLELLSGLAAVSVNRCVQSSGITTFDCQVTEGSLKGNTFTLTLDTESGEFTYDPVQISPVLPSNNVLNVTACFPDNMQSRFLFNLLAATFNQPTSS